MPVANTTDAGRARNPPATDSDASGAAARLRVDLAALQANYRTIDAATAARTAAVVKANAYGGGAGKVCGALAEAGCDTFFIALATEAVVVRRACPQASIYVLTPVIAVDAAIMIEHALMPCVYSLQSLDDWIDACAAAGHAARAALHVETGINRVGMQAAEVRQLAADPQRLRRCRLELVMGHMACGDTDADEQGAAASRHESAMNVRQLRRFETLRALFPDVPASLCNSATARLGPEYHFDLIRPGVALFGHDPHYHRKQPWCQPVVTMEAIVAQVKTIAAGERIGYGGTWQCPRDTRIAVVLAGYADGVPRALWPEPGRAGPARDSYRAWVNGHRAPLIGRVSMDMITLDVTDLPAQAVAAGDWVELFGARLPIEHIAECAGTIPYEILTQTGSRLTRIFS